MMHPRLAVAALAFSAAFTTIVRADSVSLPYQTPDNAGNQWTVFVQGNLQQQGNQPIFQQAGMITVNGQQPQQNNQNAHFDPKTNVLSINFTAAGPLHETRQFKFDDNSPVVRVIDVIENTQAAPASMNVMLTTNTNFGINDAAMVTDSKNKDAEIGWAANTQGNRAALSLFAGKGSRVLPVLRYRQGNNMVTAQYALKVPGKSTVAIVHWHGSFDTSDAATQWAQQFNERKDIGDLSLELRRQIVNMSGSGSDFVAGHELLRGAGNDVVELIGGDQMRGDLKMPGYTLATGYGTIKLSPDKVAGVVSVGGYQPRQLVVTTGGEIFGGVIQEKTLPLQLASGQTTAVPFSQIARVGCRSGGEPAPWKLDQPMAFLVSGERCRIDLPATPIDFVTRYGPLKLTAKQIAAVILSPDAESQTIYLTDGSRLSGVLDQQHWPLKLSSVQQGAPVDFSLATLSRVQFSLLADDTGAGLPSAALLGADIVSAKLTGMLKLVTPFDTLNLDASQVRSISVPEIGQPDVQITMFDQSTFRGRFDTASLSLELVAGLSLDVPVAALRDYQNPCPLPSQAIIDQANAAMKMLNADDWKQREAAEVQLVAMGETIIPVLQDGETGQPPEVKERLAAIVTKLKKDQPATPTRLTAPPVIN